MQIAIEDLKREALLLEVTLQLTELMIALDLRPFLVDVFKRLLASTKEEMLSGGNARDNALYWRKKPQLAGYQ
jgi:hypothetical protein